MTRGAFGQPVDEIVEGQFIIDIPLEQLERDGEYTLPDGTIVRITQGGQP
jgi:hypothetical protein